jgi:hypothetical protein
VAGKADGVGQLRILLVAQWLYPRVQLGSTEMLGRTRVAWRLKVATHRAQQCGGRLSTSRAETTME